MHWVLYSRCTARLVETDSRPSTRNSDRMLPISHTPLTHYVYHNLEHNLGCLRDGRLPAEKIRQHSMRSWLDTARSNFPEYVAANMIYLLKNRYNGTNFFLLFLLFPSNAIEKYFFIFPFASNTTLRLVTRMRKKTKQIPIIKIRMRVTHLLFLFNLGGPELYGFFRSKKKV